ncbi:hypothetical protein BT69DRAFT_128863 [Atractiella rhizophila]|nr:hypothetical protein BT69DRAFT_128863 [Atractiella rhizophila]
MRSEVRRKCDASLRHPLVIYPPCYPPSQVHVRRPTSERSWLDATREGQRSAKGRGVRLSEKGAAKDLVCMSVRTLVARKEREKGNTLPAERKALTRLACEKGGGVGGMRNEGPTLALRICVCVAKRGGRGRKGVEETPERSFSRPSVITDRIRPLCPPVSAFGLILDAYFAREGGRDWWRGE